MKKCFTTFLMILGWTIICFSQSQELETILTTLIGPENVDSYYEEQIRYYQDYLDELKQEIKQMLEVEQVAERKIRAKKKIRDKQKVRLAEIMDEIALLKLDLVYIDEFLLYWKEHETSLYQKTKEFSTSFDANKCYKLFFEGKELFSDKYEIIEKDLMEKIKWKEYTEYETYTSRVEVKPASTEWVKRKADRNCISSNPDDCMVWCLVEVPAEYKTVTKKGCPQEFNSSKDKFQCTNVCSTENRAKKRRKIVIQNKEYPSKELRISDYSIVECKN